MYICTYVYIHLCAYIYIYVFTGGDWIGHYNQTTKLYDSINTTNIEQSILVVQKLVDLHKDDPIIIGLEPRKLTKNPSS
jgi:hypothetical protein